MEKNTKKHYLIAAILGIAVIVALTAYYLFSAFSSHVTTQYVYIDDDDTADSVYHKLEPIAKQLPMSAFTTLSRYWNYEENVRSGRYAIEPSEATFTVFRRIKNGQQTPVKLTIPESRTMDRLAGALAKKLMLDSLRLADALRDSAFCAQLGYDTCTIACLFVPNTYEIYWNTSLERLMQRMEREHKAFWNIEREQKARNLSLTPNEVCTLASIIDEETANNAEKPMIAGMYLNRLSRQMPLQADPTVKFALKDFALRRIYQKQLAVNSPYNTYRNEGLPPGPIKVASIAGIDAVLNAVKHDYLYMCAKEDFSGTHNFASTYAEHLKNAAKYARALNQRGIK